MLSILSITLSKYYSCKEILPNTFITFYNTCPCASFSFSKTLYNIPSIVGRSFMNKFLINDPSIPKPIQLYYPFYLTYPSLH